jgi:hypothetical protein
MNAWPDTIFFKHFAQSDVSLNFKPTKLLKRYISFTVNIFSCNDLNVGNVLRPLLKAYTVMADCVSWIYRWNVISNNTKYITWVNISYIALYSVRTQGGSEGSGEILFVEKYFKFSCRFPSL